MRRRTLKTIIASIFGAIVVSSIPLVSATWNTGGEGRTPVGASTTVSPTNTRPVCYTKASNGTKTYYGDLAKCINSTTSGTIYIIPNLDFDVEISEDCTLSGATLILPCDENENYDGSKQYTNDAVGVWGDSSSNVLTKTGNTNTNMISSVIVKEGIKFTIGSTGKVYVGGKTGGYGNIATS